MHNARVVLSPLGRSTETGEEGAYQFTDVPAGTYQVVVSLEGLSDERQRVEVGAGATATADFALRLAAVKQQVTVTASGREEVALEAISTVASLDSLELTSRAAPSLGDVLDNEPGIAKRSFGPGTTRPVVRGFDGDRVLILEDGMRTGTLSSQSGDHGEPVDVTDLERVEVIRGPATLLYGSNALGGVVNAVSRHGLLHQHPHQGVKGFLTGTGGSTNSLGGGSAGLEIGLGRWQLWGVGGGQRTGNYRAPAGTIQNSKTRSGHGSGGVGRFGDKGFFSLNYLFSDARYGIPFDPEEEEPEIVDLALRRHAVRFNGGVKNVGSFLDNWQFNVNYSDYNHKELAGEEVGTEFFNKQVIYRTVFDQRKHGRNLGSFGAWGMYRDYKAIGEESLAPPTTQNAFAAFVVESFDFESTRLQFGGRVERNAYNPTGLEKRTFTGFSGSAGLSQKIAGNVVFVANYTHSYRAPALEELYNHGPHPGNLAFEVGDSELVREGSDGVDFSLRHHSRRLRAEANFFYYRLRDFVYLAPTGEIEDGLLEAEYRQANSSYRGGEGRLDVGLHQNLWLNLVVDGVRASLTKSDTPLPRIPPVRGRIGLDVRHKGLSVRPELVLASDQNRIFPTESGTAGYGVFNLGGSYTIVRQHNLHMISATLFNSGDRLYRNHLSFIKGFAPEIGRGVRVAYTIRFF